MKINQSGCKAIAGAMSVLLLSTASLVASTGTAFAQYDHHGDGRSDGDHGRGDQGRGDQGHGDQGHGDHGRGQQHAGWGQDYGGGHHWRRGQRMGYNDWNGAQPVDYRQRHLRRPPNGYEWRESNGQYVLAAVATGLIASIILNANR